MSWPMVQFGQLYAEPSRNGVYKSKEHHGTGVKIVNMGELFAYDTIGEQEMKRLSMSASEMSKSGLSDGDLLFGRRSLVESGAGKCCLVDGLNEPTTFESSIIRVRVNESLIRPRFVFYWLKSPQGAGRVRAIVTGTNVKGIRGTVLKTIEFACPPVDVQDTIISKLRIYDDLIENNRRRIHLLEQAARLLYKEWFVHLRFPGHEHVKMKDGVPEGWEKTSVGSVSLLISRGITPKYDEDGVSTVINQKCIRDQRVTMELARRQSKEVPPKKLVQYGDVLINSTGQGTLGRTAQFLNAIEGCTVDSHLTISRPEKRVPVIYYGHTITSMEDYLATMGRGATNQTELSKDAIVGLPFLCPPRLITEQFENFATETARQIQNFLQQNVKLSEARDLLLPRLMNGEIAI
jgi:type I restriction enzyme S subunit